MEMEFRDLAAGTKKSERFRVEDRVESTCVSLLLLLAYVCSVANFPSLAPAVILDVQKCTYSRSEGKKLYFTNAETGEEVSVRKDLVGPVESYLKRIYSFPLPLVTSL